ncbi:MAG: alanine racemase [Actinomycetota bacterium]
MRPSWVEIDLEAIRHNVATLAELVDPAGVCAVVKADAYGHGDAPVAEAALNAGAKSLAVALLEEGIRLREAGVVAPVLLLSEPDRRDASEVVHWRLTPTVYRETFARALGDAGGKRVQVKVDTGMHRVGVAPDRLPGLLDAAGNAGLEVEAIWTHLAVAEEDPNFTLEQIARFDRALREVVGSMVAPAQHLANTAGAILYPEARRHLVRCGIGIYGIHPGPATIGMAELWPSMSIISRVAFTQRLPVGSRPSYGRRRSLAAEATVATVPIGYADGYPRSLSRDAEVLIGGRRHPLAGTVTMDQILVDAGNHPVAVGDEVVLLGRQGEEEITADEWAARLGTIAYEIVCQIGPRLPRRYRS